MLNRNDDQNEAKKMVLFCVAAASMVLLLFLAMLYMHESKQVTKHVVKEQVEEAPLEEEVEVGKSNIVSEDLDFWDMYDKDEYTDDEEDEVEEKKTINKKSSNAFNSSTKRKAFTEDDDESINESMNSRSSKDKEDMDDGKHIKVTSRDGKAEWFEILEDLKKNSYKFDEYLTYDNGYLKYSSSDVKSYNGIDISSKLGVIDFAKVKNAGVDFIMIKVAARGYESGQVTIDERFVEYANGATTAGIPIGLFVNSQAITDVEAVEEANFAVAAAANYNVKYPIAIDLTEVTNDKARTDKLNNEERTAIVKKFCETVAGYGKTPAICASRDFLITKLNLADLTDYDVWLKDEAVTADYMRVEHISGDDEDDEDDDKSSSSSSSSTSKRTTSSSSEMEENKLDYVGTDYPYLFKLWKYTEKGSINGIESPVNMDMSFVNYAER